MRNPDYREMYQQVLEAEKRGQWDGLTQDERTKKEIAGNKARTISVKQAKLGKGTGKRGVAPVAPPNLAQEDIDQMVDALIDDGFATDYEQGIQLLEVMSDEWFNLLLDERVDSKKPMKPLNSLQRATGGRGVPDHEPSFMDKVGRERTKAPVRPGTHGRHRSTPMPQPKKSDGKPPMI